MLNDNMLKDRAPVGLLASESNRENTGKTILLTVSIFNLYECKKEGNKTLLLSFKSKCKHAC